MSTQTNGATEAIKVFRMDDCLWYAGVSWVSAVRQYCKETGVKAVDLRDDPPHELTDEEMEQTVYVEHDLDDKCEPLPFRRALELMIGKGQSFPCMFATTEW